MGALSEKDATKSKPAKTAAMGKGSVRRVSVAAIPVSLARPALTGQKRQVALVTALVMVFASNRGAFVPLPGQGKLVL